MTISDKIRDLCRKKGISVTILEKELGFGNGSLTKKDNSSIRFDRLETIANYFNVPITYFSDLNMEEIKEMADRAAQVLDSPYVQLAKRIEALPADKRNLLERYICLLEES